MNRIVGSVICIAAASSVFAQAPFTIVRPSDGSRVRETIHLMVPKGSVPDGAYVGLYAGGKFIIATSEPSEKKGKFDIYDINTKALKLPDGPLSLEAVLYQKYDNVTRVVARSSVNVTLENSAAKWIPDNGIYLRYKWIPDTYSLYDVSIKLREESGSSTQNQLGARPAEQSQDLQHIQMKYTCVGRDANGDGIVSMQALPPAGHNSVYLQLAGDTQPRLYTTDMMSNVFMKLTPLGISKWGAVPFAVPFDGSGASTNLLDLYADFPLPVLPYERVKLGSSWPGRFQNGVLDMAKLLTTNKVTESFPCRGQFVDVEWEGGHPCAKIENTIAVGESSLESKELKKKSANFTGDKIKLNQTVWFALDTHQVVKIDQLVTLQQRAVTSNSGYGGPMGPGAGGPMGPGGPNGPGGGPAGPPSGPGGGSSSSDVNGPIGYNQFKGGGGMSGPTGGAGAPPTGMGGRPGGFGGFGRGGAPTGTSQTGFVRVVIEYIYTLEK